MTDLGERSPLVVFFVGGAGRELLETANAASWEFTMA
jgi:hypothetical protein